MAKYLNDTGLTYFYNKLKTVFQAKESGKGLSTNDYTTAEKNKLSGIASGAEVNQNAFSNVKVGTTTVAADAKTDTLTLEAGSNVTLTPDATNDKITIAATDTTYSDATQSAHGLMSANDKKKLDGVDTGAEVNVIETVKKNGTALTVTDKAIDISVPTKTSDLTNDSNFITLADVPEGAVASSTSPKMDGTATVGTETAFARGDHVHPTDTSRASASDLTSHTGNTSNPHGVTKAQVGLGNVTNESKATMFTNPALTGTPTAPTASAGTNTTQIATTAFVKTAVDNAVAGVTQIDIQVVESLPTTGVKGVIYLMSHSHGTGDAYDEYIWTGSAYEKIGNTDVDLSGYWAKADLVAITTSEIDTLFA